MDATQPRTVAEVMVPDDFSNRVVVDVNGCARWRGSHNLASLIGQWARGGSIAVGGA